LRLSCFARKKEVSAQSLPTAGWLLSLVRKKSLLSQSRQAAKGFFFAPFLLCEKKKKLARKDAKGFSLRLCAFASVYFF